MQNINQHHNSLMSSTDKTRRWDILSFGDPVADLVFGVQLPPLQGEKVLGYPLGTWPGGTTSNLACAASRIGLKVAVYGRLGDDEYATILQSSFADFGVNTEYLDTSKHSHSALAITMLSASGEKSIIFVPKEAHVLDETRLREAIRQTRILYAMPYNLAELETLSRIAREEGTLVAIDIEAAVAPDSVAMLERISCADIVFFNESGFVAGTGKKPHQESMAKLLAAGPQLVVVTLGADGVIAVSKNSFAKQSAFKADVVDTTGAGDTFNAAFLTAYIEKQTLQDALHFSCAAASKTVSTLGARTGMPTRDEILTVLSRGLNTI